MRRYAVLISVAIILVLALVFQVWPRINSGLDNTSAGLTGPDAMATKTAGAANDPSAQIDNPEDKLAGLPIQGPNPNDFYVLKPHKIGDASPPSVNAEQVAVIDEASGELLYGKNEHQKTPMASTTKIATAIVALERGNIWDVVDVDYDPNKLYDSTAMGCNPGDQYTLENLLYGLMLPSGNDAALAIANHIAGSEEAFVEMMNDKAQELGLRQTHFSNPHGLDEPDHHSSAHDMAVLARYGMNDPTFQLLAAAKIWDVTGTKDYRIFNLNRLLWEYEGADGVKIGFTEGAGRSTVASATVDGRRVYVAFMHGQDIVDDVAPLFNYAFENYEWRQEKAFILPTMPTPTPSAGSR